MRIKQSYDLRSQSKSRSHRMFAPSRLTALVKEMIAPFSCPNHGWKRSKQRRKCKFAVFSTRGRRSTKVIGWLRASKHQKTDLLGFEEVYSVAREAKNKLWSSHREPYWTKRNSAKIFCRGENKQENRSHAKCLDWYTSCYSPYNYGTTYFKVDKHPERCRVYTSEQDVWSCL